jgi:hypothetical protein
MPNPSDAQAKRLIKFYNEAEILILNECSKILLGKDLYNAQERIDQIKKDLLEGSRQWAEEALPDSYQKGIDAADELIPKDKESIADFEQIHTKTIASISEEAYSRLADVVSVVGRRIDAIFQTMDLQTAKKSATGNQEALDNIIEKIKTDLAEKGITGFVDRAGNAWDMSRYAEVLAQESTMQSFREGITNRLQEKAQDLVFIPAHSGSCKKCAEFEGKMFSLSGSDEEHPALDEAIEGGMFHPNCTHYVEAYRKTAK